MNQHFKTILVWIVIFLAFSAVWSVFFNRAGGQAAAIPQSELYKLVEEGQVRKLTLQGDQGGFTVRGKKADGSEFTAYTVKDDGLVKLLRDKGVEFNAEKANDNSVMISLLSGVVPLLLILGVWVFLYRQMQSGGNKAMSFGKSRAKLLTPQGKKITFKDVAGVSEAKQEIEEII